MLCYVNWTKFGTGQIPLRYPAADQITDLVADLRVRVVCVSQTGRKLVESQLQTSLQPGLQPGLRPG